MIKLLCYPKEYKTGQTAEFELLFQAVQNFSCTSTNEITKRRIETGFAITDNSYINPQTISMSGIVGDINRNPHSLITGLYDIPIMTNFKNKTYIENLKMGLERARNAKMFIVLYNTKDGKYYYNYLISNLEIIDSHKTKMGFEYWIQFQEAKIGTVGATSNFVRNKNPNAPSINGDKGQGKTSNVGNDTESLIHGYFFNNKTGMVFRK